MSRADTARRLGLTAARRRALHTLYAAHHNDRPCKVSNTTSHPNAATLAIYWQTAQWLIETGLATAPHELITTGHQLTITPAGITAATELGLSV